MGIHTDFPQRSGNTHKGDWNFWDDLGVDVDRVDTIRELKQGLYTAPTARIVKDTMVVNRYGTAVENPEGQLGESAAREILGRPARPGEEIVVRMFSEGGWPVETYDAFLEVVDPGEASYAEEVRELYDEGYILLEEVPDGFERGLYDFYVMSEGGEYAVIEPSAAVDLDKWT